MEQALGRCVASWCPGATGVANAARLSGGASQETWSFDILHPDGNIGAILRRAPQGSGAAPSRAAGLDARKMSVRTAGDICAMMAMLGRREAVSREASEDMLRILRRCQGRAELSHLLPWNELNMLPDPRENWVAEKGGAFINGIRTGGALFHSGKGHVAMSVFGEGMLAGRSDHEAEGNKLLWEMGKAAWDTLAS